MDEYDAIMKLLGDIIARDVMVVVEGNKDKRALEELGVKNIKVLKKSLYETVEEIKDEDEVVLLVDLDRQGKKIYSRLMSDLVGFGVKINNKLREYLFKNTKLRQIEGLTTAIPEQFFPPCIQHISRGLEDGRKRAIFILINFLKSIGWPHDKVESYIKQWNKRNPEQLRENYLIGQLRYSKGKKSIPPPNCANNMYMTGIGVCHPDNLCSRIKNPAQYAKRKSRGHQKK